MGNEQNEKTEEATPKRKQKERNKGHISKSQDFTSSLMLTLGLGLIFTMGAGMLEELRTMLTDALSHLNPKNIPQDNFVAITGIYFNHLINIVCLFFAFLAIGAVVILRFQTGALFAKEALKPNLKKLLNLLNKL